MSRPARRKSLRRTCIDRLASSVILAVSLCAQQPAQPLDSARPLAITSVNVIDVSAGTARSALKKNQTVLLQDGRIKAVGAPGTVALPANALRKPAEAST